MGWTRTNIGRSGPASGKRRAGDKVTTLYDIACGTARLVLHRGDAMSLPRPVIAGQTSMVSRRCARREYLCRPEYKVNQILGYCLAVAAARYGIVLHAFCCLSNHVHLVLTDVHGNQPEFFRWFFEFTAKCLNAHWGRWENLWAARFAETLREADAILLGYDRIPHDVIRAAIEHADSTGE